MLHVRKQGRDVSMDGDDCEKMCKIQIGTERRPSVFPPWPLPTALPAATLSLPELLRRVPGATSAQSLTRIAGPPTISSNNREADNEHGAVNFR